MKKRLLSLLLAAAMLLSFGCLCGCDRLSTEKNLIGAWRSEDGYTVTFNGQLMTVYDTDGNELDGFPAAYTVSGNILYAAAGGTLTPLFECRADGDSLTLIYTDSFLELALGSAEKSVSISLTRCDTD